MSERAWTAAQASRIKRLYIDRDWRIPELARHFNVDVRQIYDLLIGASYNEVEPRGNLVKKVGRGNRCDLKTMDRMRRLHKEGLSHAVIGRELGVVRATVWFALNHNCKWHWKPIGREELQQLVRTIGEDAVMRKYDLCTETMQDLKLPLGKKKF